MPLLLLGGAAAAITAALTMALLRATLQVRTVPERLLEWALLLVPPGLFEATLQRFGFDTKRYALSATVAATLAVLTVLGAFALGRRWSGAGLLALGIGLWLLVMLVVMPLTSAGWFASALLEGSANAVVGYLAVCLAYAVCLQVARVALDRQHAPSDRPYSSQTRRAALVGLASTCAALVGTYLIQFVTVRRRLAEVRVLDPQEPVPSGGIDQQPPHPEGGSTPNAPAPATAPPAAAAAQPPRETPLPEPRPIRPMKRDKDGAILPAGRREGQLTELITSNDDFYVVTKNAAGDPIIDARTWSLRIDGEVMHPIELDYTSLRRLPAVELTRTLECISNFAAKCEMAPFGCDLISTARWRGVRVSSILELAGGIKPETSFLAVVGADEYTSAVPLEAALDPNTLLVFEMNGEVLPREHGYPARLLVPGRYGMKNAKWVIGLRPVAREFVDWYGQRNWSKDGFVRTMSRIDLPQRGSDLAPGEYNIAGIAYAGDRGISRVEFSTDGGQSWQAADFLEPQVDRDTWVR